MYEMILDTRVVVLPSFPLLLLRRVVVVLIQYLDGHTHPVSGHVAGPTSIR